MQDVLIGYIKERYTYQLTDLPQSFAVFVDDQQIILLKAGKAKTLCGKQPYFHGAESFLRS
jgi:hypothetical protein